MDEAAIKQQEGGMKVFIVSDCELMRVAFSVILKQAADIEVLGRSDLQSIDLVSQIAKSGCDVVLLSARASLSLTVAVLTALKASNPKLLVLFMETALDAETARSMPFDGIVSIADNNDMIIENLRQLYRNRMQPYSPRASYNSIQSAASG
jgi:DNA-binding NarL/FixJ family response regulator